MPAVFMLILNEEAERGIFFTKPYALVDAERRRRNGGGMAEDVSAAALKESERSIMDKRL